MHRFINQAGLDLIKYFEGFSNERYLCSAGFETIGYGHKILSGEKYHYISKDEADEILKNDLYKAEKSVLYNINSPLRDNQYSALVSFAFNLGGGSLQRSTLRQKVNYSLNEEAADEFLKWVYSNGKKLNGLIKRREAERDLFLLD